MQPLKLKPVFKEKIWGSDRLRRVYGKPLPDGKKVGESWELCDFPADCSVIANGSHAGKTFRDMLDKHGAEIGFRPEQCQHPFGLLIKFLDADDDLSVQVHPDRQACQILPDADLKTECWAILATEPDSVIYKGFKGGVGRADVRAAIDAGRVDELLEVVPVKAGDFHFLPAGTVHAIGAGIVIAEIQTPSDTTYRLFDWNRTDAEGNSRPLHIEESLLCCHYTDESSPPTGPEEFEPSDHQENLHRLAQHLGQTETLLDCSFFSVLRTTITDSLQDGLRHKAPAVVIVLSGSGKIGNPNDAEPLTTFQPGDTLLLPRMDNLSFQANSEVQCLLTCLGPEMP